VKANMPHSDRSPLRNAAGFSLPELLVTVVVMLLVLGVVAQFVGRSSVMYAQQRDHMERRYTAATTADIILRLLRQAGTPGGAMPAATVVTDPDGNGVLDSIRIVSDWNPRDGAADDPYEDIQFSVAGNTLFKREPADAAPVPFGDNINGLTFAYFNPGGGAVLNPLVATQDQLAYVTMTIRTQAVDGQPGIVLSSSASIRRLE
jgi:prepilin-type N-terminal cleavage/methylation domain-containing protein